MYGNGACSLVQPFFLEKETKLLLCKGRHTQGDLRVYSVRGTSPCDQMKIFHLIFSFFFSS